MHKDERITLTELVERAGSWVVDSTFLGRLNREEVEECLEHMVWRDYPRGHYITHVGQPARGVDLLLSGQAVVYAIDERKKMSPIAHVSAGAVIGERSVVRHSSQLADVITSSRVRALHMSKEACLKFYQTSDRFKAYVEGLIALRERWGVLLSLLSQNPFLRSLGMDDAERLLQYGELITIKPGEYVVRAGERSTEVYVVVHGSVGILAPAKDGQPAQSVGVAEPGDLVGHASVLLETSRSADVIGLEDAELLRIGSTAFMDIVTRNPLVQRQLLQYLATLEMPAARKMKDQIRRYTLFVCAGERGLGSTTIAYGIAGAIRDTSPPLVVDLDGPETSARLRFSVRKRKMLGFAIEEMQPTDEWGFRIIWPAAGTDPGKFIAALKNDRSKSALKTPVVVSGRFGTPAGDAVLEQTEAVVFVRRASDPLCDLPTRRGQLRYQAVRIEEGVPLPLATSRRAVRIPIDNKSVEAFWNSGDLLTIATLATPFGRATERLARAVRGRSVGVALGGGGALGFAHIGLLRVLERAGITVDYVSGVSFGSLVGAIYVGGGLPALEDLIRQRWLLTGYVSGALLTTRVFEWFVNRVVGKQHLGETEIPFYPVGLNLSTGKEFVLSSGSLGMSVRSSSCMPGAFPALTVGTARLVDGGMINNVPASTIWQAGSDFIIGSNIIPPNPEGSRPPLGSVPYLGKALFALARVDDTVRALYTFASQAGRDRSLMADFIFDLSIEGHNIYDFPTGDAIADAGQKLAEDLLPGIIKAHSEDNSIRF